VAQRYLHKPYLIDGLKFDLRVYVLITSVTPLRIFIYKEGLARFATNLYTPPTGSNLQNVCMHLTNYAINKESTKFKQATSNTDEKAHKRTMTSVLAHVDQCMQPEVISGA
jgi:tubulin polyglutamylase TTLL6/13